MSPVHRIRTKSASTGGSGPPGSITYNQYAAFFEKKGPATYATGGFVIDLSAIYTSINFCKLLVKKGSRGSLPGGGLEYLLNSPTAGKVTVKVKQYQYDSATAIGNVANQPSGVTVEAASGVVTNAESAHVHTMTHDHAATASSAATNTGAGVNSSLVTLSQNVGSHTHSVDPPNLAVDTGAGSSHTHADNNIYQHGHSATLTPTNLSAIELANASVALATTTWLGMASGVRV